MVNQYNMSFPNKKELESKWWHRLFKVILISATIVSLLVAGYLFYENILEEETVILSFEDNYGKIQKEDERLTDIDPQLDIASRAMDRIEKIDPPVLSNNSYEFFSWDLHKELYPEKYFKEGVGKLLPWTSEQERKECQDERNLSPAEFIRMCRNAEIRVPSSCFEQMIQEYPDWQIKSWRPVRWQALLFFLFPIAVYLILWLLYQKVILYIVYGKRS